MRQRAIATSRSRSNFSIPVNASLVPQLSVFLTDTGWCGLWGQDKIVFGLTIGHVSGEQVRRAVSRKQTNSVLTTDWPEEDWYPGLRRRLETYFQGMNVDFEDSQLQKDPMTTFQRGIIAATRRIPFGRTQTYGQLAAQVGSPGAARAVGNVMKSNRFPIIVPCHRVVAAGGKLGGYSAPQGLDLKKRLLLMESAAI